MKRSNQASTVRFRSDGTVSVFDFATENAFDSMQFDGNTISRLTGPEDQLLTSDSVLFWTADLKHNPRRMCTEVASLLAIPM